MNESVQPAQGAQPHNGNARKHGHYSRLKALKSNGFNAIDARTWAGKKAKDWKAYVLATKSENCGLHVKQEIELAALDVWILLSLVDVIVEDARQRGALINKRAKTLPKIHREYETISQRFARRCEALQLDKGAGGLDLARRLMQVNGR